MFSQECRGLSQRSQRYHWTVQFDTILNSLKVKEARESPDFYDGLFCKADECKELIWQYGEYRLPGH